MDITKPFPLLLGNKQFPSFLLGFLISVAYIPGVIGATISTGWFVLIAVAPFCLYRLPGLFIAFAILSLAWTVNFNIGVFFLLQLVALACIFQLGEKLKDPKPIFHGLALGLGFSSLLALLQYFYQYRGVYTLNTQNGSVAGLFINSNIYSEISAVLLIALIVFRLYWWIPVTLPGLIIVPSRSAIVALAVSAFIWLWNNKRPYCLLFLLAIPVVLFHRGNFSSIQERLDLWADTINGLTLFGNGVGSFEIQYPLNATHIDTANARPKYAHNDLLQLFFEFGIGTLLLVTTFKRLVNNEYSIILYAIGTISLFTYPFHVPMLAFIGCLVAGFVTNSNAVLCTSRNYGRSNLLKRSKGKRYSTV